MKISLSWQILAASVLGVVTGFFASPDLVDLLGTVGRLFIAALKMLIIPLIFFSIVAAIARLQNARAIGRIGTRTVGLYLLTMAFAVGTGLLLVNIVDPGMDSRLLESPIFQDKVAAHGSPTMPSTGDSLKDLVFSLFQNPFDALAAGQILPIVFLGVLLGIAIVQVGAAATPLRDLFEAAQKVIMRIVDWVVRLAPIGVFALVANLIATIDFQLLVENLASFAFVVVAATLIHAFITLPMFAWMFRGIGPIELFRGIGEALIVALSTSSSAATLPVTTRCVEENLHVPRSVSSFVLPLGATVNMDGTALYEAIAAVFVANIYGMELSLAAQLVVFLIAMLTAVGAPGIPSAGMVTMVVVLEALGLPTEAVAILITIDRALDTVRTMANVEGDAVVALCVSEET